MVFSRTPQSWRLPQASRAAVVARRRRRLPLVSSYAKHFRTISSGLLYGMQTQTLSSNVTTCSAAISVCGKESQPRTALSRSSRMRRQFLLHNATTCSAAISACEKGS